MTVGHKFIYCYMGVEAGDVYLYIICLKQLLRALLNYIVSIEGTVFIGRLYIISTMCLNSLL